MLSDFTNEWFLMKYSFMQTKFKSSSYGASRIELFLYSHSLPSYLLDNLGKFWQHLNLDSLCPLLLISVLTIHFVFYSLRILNLLWLAFFANDLFERTKHCFKFHLFFVLIFIFPYFMDVFILSHSDILNYIFLR